jgi:hypothetical protein
MSATGDGRRAAQAQARVGLLALLRLRAGWV